MADKDKALPKPPNKAFGNKKRFEEEDDQSTLIADRMAAAMAEGRLDEFIKQVKTALILWNGYSRYGYNHEPLHTMLFHSTHNILCTFSCHNSRLTLGT